MPAKTPIGFGVLGTASIARRAIIPALAALPGHFSLQGIASRDADRVARASEEFQCRGYAGYEALLRDPRIEAVYIPLPNALHHQYVLLALEHGKHVLVEKSLGCSFEEVRDISAAAAARGLVVLENFQFRFHRQLAEILDLVRDGAIGQLRSVRVAFGCPPFPDAGNIRYQAALGGGALLDMGAYPMKIAPYFLGRDLFVGHASMAFVPDRDVDIWGAGVLQQRNGPLQCHFSYGFDHHYQCALELWGSTGKLTTGRIFTAPASWSPVITIETASGRDERQLAPDDHFANALHYFHRLMTGQAAAADEHEGNLRQAGLLQAFRERAEVPAHR